MGDTCLIHIQIYFLLIASAESWIAMDLMKNKIFLEIEVGHPTSVMRTGNTFKIKENSSEICILIAKINKNKIGFKHVSRCSTITVETFQCTFRFGKYDLLGIEFYYLCSLDVTSFRFFNLERYFTKEDLFMAIHSRSFDGSCLPHNYNDERNAFLLYSLGVTQLNCFNILCSDDGFMVNVSLSQSSRGSNVLNCSKMFQKQKKIKIKRATFMNNPPLLNSRHFVINVLEEQPPGLILDVNISAADPDEGDAGKLTYSLMALKDQRSQSLFEINPFTGSISTIQKLDRETMSIHFFRILVQDYGKPNMYDEALLTVYVKDINDHKPKFDNNMYVKVASENIAPRSELLTVHAIDEDSDENGEITYAILNAEEIGHKFDIDSRSGVITTTSKLDRETKEFYVLKILATDNANSFYRSSSSCLVEVTLQDENDNSPQFMNISYYFEIEENIYHFGESIIGSIYASDADLGNNGYVRYTITSGNSLGHFSIDPDNGTLFMAGPLDYENIQTYKLFVRAQDQGNPPKSNTTSITINVLDSNDNEPKFDVPYYHNSIYENVVIGFSVLKVRAYDADSGLYGMVRYFIRPECNVPFMINEEGYITTINNTDRETQSIYVFEVVACDFDAIEKCSEAAVEITIMDINDNSPVFEHKIYNSTVMEDSKPGSIVATVKATDADEDVNSRIIYKIVSGNDGGFFNLVTQVGYGIISISRILNYRQQNKYKLVVSASDSMFEDTAIIFISILHVNLHRPIFLGTPYQVRLPEDISVGQVIFNVSAFDADFGDNAKISYFLYPNETFSINEFTGEMNLKRPLDREAEMGYTLTLTAIDHGHPQKLDFADIEIVVIDANDNPPTFSENYYHASVSEDALIGTYVLTVQATDVDEGENNKIRYVLEDFKDFKIDSSLGIIRTTKELDREKVPIYTFIVYAIDGGKPPLTGSAQLKIEIEDVNDNAPIFESPHIKFHVKENIPLRSSIGEIRAFDLDEGFNAHINFFILPGYDDEAFNLDNFGNKTFLMSAAEFDFESSKKELIVRVRARSHHLFADTLITVFIDDVNDNMPMLKDFDIIFNNYKDYFNLGYIGKVPAYDLDVNDKLKYKIVYGNQGRLLHLNETTGLMKLDSRLNSDVPTNGTLIISVTDGLNEVRATCKLYVRLVTEEMLSNSIKIQISYVDQTSFLGTSYNLLTSAVATMVSSSPEDVFIISIQNGSSILGGKLSIINVTFAIRCHAGLNGDEFFTREFLKNKLYFFKLILMKLSFIKILPFEDDPCIKEPCLNFEACSSTLKFDGSSNIISSDSMFFRPIQTANTFTCHCPQGFAGLNYNYLCDVEVNLCFSNPCTNNGTCLQTEGGYLCLCIPSFKGIHCEEEFKMMEVEACQKNKCQEPSVCVPVDRGKFRCQMCDAGACKNCEDLPGFNEFCDLISKSFEEGSYLMFPPIKKRHRFNITLRFATKNPDGMLLYNGRHDGHHDFILLEIRNKQLQFSFSLGSQITTLTTFVETGVNTGQWIAVNIAYYNRTTLMVVGEKCDSSRLHAKGCANSASQLLEQRCEDVTEICYRLLDLTGPLLIGGLPPSTEYNPSVILTPYFSGCISNFSIDQKPVDLNTYVSENATNLGCTHNKNFCFSNPCLNGGNCINRWGGFKCDCPNEFVGRYCSTLAPSFDYSIKLLGNSSISFMPEQHRLPPIELPWFVAFYMRTTQSYSTLFHLTLLNDKETYPFSIDVTIELMDGKIECVFQNSSRYQLDEMVNDGIWHHILVTLANRQLTFDVDYGLSQLSHNVESKITGYHVGKIIFGGRQGIGEEELMDGFKGCFKSIKVGSNIAEVMTNRTEINTQQGCKAMNLCTTNLHECNQNSSKCISIFDNYRCKCNPGYEGSFCQKAVCEAYEPCNTKFSRCVMDDNSPHGYKCICDNKHCQEAMALETSRCPPSWWGSPVCGPCNCLSAKGYSTNCDQKTGRCFCKPNHYLRNAECLPCDCYTVGSLSLACDAFTGQCPCHGNVTGRRCDTCSNKMAQVTAKGCEIVYNGCPQSFDKNVWWDKTPWNTMATMDCPIRMAGAATRYCDKSSGWNEPNMKNCSSLAFSNLKLLLEALDSKNLELNTFVSKDILSRLKRATNVSEHELTVMDIDLTQKLLNRILLFESKQEGLDMVHSQDRSFIQSFVNVVGDIIDTRYYKEWKLIHMENPDTALALITGIFMYLKTLTLNMQKLFTPSFDVTHKNFLLGLDWIGNRHTTAYVKLPKFDNKLRQQMVLDFHTQIHFPLQALPFQNDETSKAYIYYGYVMFRNLGIIMPLKYDEKFGKQITSFSIINSTMLHMCMINGGSLKPFIPDASMVIKFGNMHKTKHSDPKCVMLSEGMWTQKGCKLAGEDVITCICNNISTYAIITESAEQESHLKPFIFDIASYVTLTLSMILQFSAFSIFFFINIVTTITNVIHLNLSANMFLSFFVILFSIDRVHNKELCRIAAIFLHLFWLNCHSWMFVKFCHFYRRITDIKDVNHGSAHTFYVIGYVFPGVIVSLAVGLNTDAYGCQFFCWLPRGSVLSWGFILPMTCYAFSSLIALWLSMFSLMKRWSKHDSGLKRHFKYGLGSDCIMLTLMYLSSAFLNLSLNFAQISLYRYLFLTFSTLQSTFLICVYIAFSEEARQQIHYVWYKTIGRKNVFGNQMIVRQKQKSPSFQKESFTKESSEPCSRQVLRGKLLQNKLVVKMASSDSCSENDVDENLEGNFVKIYEKPRQCSEDSEISTPEIKVEEFTSSEDEIPWNVSCL